MEGLDPAESYAVLERHAPGAIRRYRSETELRFLVGTGVSAAAIWRMREALDAAGYPRVRIVASSGFGVDKCRVMADAKAPIDVVGTGSFIPDAWHETYATADIVEYDTQYHWSSSAASSCCAKTARAKRPAAAEQQVDFGDCHPITYTFAGTPGAITTSGHAQGAIGWPISFSRRRAATC